MLVCVRMCVYFFTVLQPPTGTCPGKVGTLSKFTPALTGNTHSLLAQTKQGAKSRVSFDGTPTKPCKLESVFLKIVTTSKMLMSSWLILSHNLRLPTLL